MAIEAARAIGLARGGDGPRRPEADERGALIDRIAFGSRQPRAAGLRQIAAGGVGFGSDSEVG